jgi:hypothetical protein
MHNTYQTPTSLGSFDKYEGFAQVPGEISWRFPLYPAPPEALKSLLSLRETIVQK